MIRGLSLLVDPDRAHAVRKAFRHEYEVAMQLRFVRPFLFLSPLPILTARCLELI